MVIPGAMFIPESRVSNLQLVEYARNLDGGLFLFLRQSGK